MPLLFFSILKETTMAAVEGELTIFGMGSYRILEFEYEMHVETDSLGRPSSRLRGGQLIFTIVTPKGNDPNLYEWLNTYTFKNGFARFGAAGSRWKCSIFPEEKTIHFDHAYCISIREYFNCGSTGQMVMKITLQPGILMPALYSTSSNGGNLLQLKLLPTMEDMRNNANLQNDNTERVQSIHKDKF